ncbi:hypothetical protein [Cytobacillus oceanisediminis]|uniref:Uncharacterized protein n=1 Tax=Cytobacillus oceanisediminis 2691 TaxID=1196031 RepID=A0A160MF05_9BACI|nr:hypothetical protein [Cytobacillus oceanisediminis]AND41464.1 hypothetical protein A361_20625 [Cytobacillus oceanisediminis 2691]
MKKTLISLAGGLILGLISSILILNYNGWTYIHHNKNGEVEKVINELDFNLLTNSLLLIFASTILIYVLISFFEKRKNKVKK